MTRIRISDIDTLYPQGLLDAPRIIIRTKEIESWHHTDIPLFFSYPPVGVTLIDDPPVSVAPVV